MSALLYPTLGFLHSDDTELVSLKGQSIYEYAINDGSSELRAALTQMMLDYLVLIPVTGVNNFSW